jgi:DNA gyrase subunit B
MKPELPSKLVDCRHFCVETTELFLVEGDSASSAILETRNPQLQAVLPLQGKPLNAWKASRKKVAENHFYQAIVSALGAGWDSDFDLTKRRYERVVLVFDPDADGIHCGALVTMFFYRWMRPLLEAGCIEIVRAPLFQIVYDDCAELICMEDDITGSAEVQRLIASGKTNVVKKRFRGLGSMGRQILHQYCVNPKTRRSETLLVGDAEAAIAVFCP